MADLDYIEESGIIIKMKSRLGFVITIVIFFLSCDNNAKNSNLDTPEKGIINISVDETFKPVIAEQIKIYESSFRGARINAHYKSEVDCFKDLQQDSTRMIIVARGLKEDEDKFFESKLRFHPLYGVLAYDAVAVIVNNAAKDSVFTVADLHDMFTGKKFADKQIVVDGNNATSTVRFLMDSVLKGEKFSKNVQAAKNSKDVVEAIASDKNAIGFVGSSWVGNEQDPEQAAFIGKVKFALLECKTCPEKGTFARPSQGTILYRQYPLRRPLYYILKENRTGLGTGFMNFMSLERGQLIFRRAYLAPAKMDFQLRSGSIKD